MHYAQRIKKKKKKNKKKQDNLINKQHTRDKGLEPPDTIFEPWLFQAGRHGLSVEPFDRAGVGLALVTLTFMLSTMSTDQFSSAMKTMNVVIHENRGYQAG